LIAEVEGQRLYRKKCDFDMEVCIDVHGTLDTAVESFLLGMAILRHCTGN